jgi:nitrate reductase delta subunit
MKRAAAATVFGCAAVLLSYPDEQFAADVTAAAGTVGRLPAGRPRTLLATVTEWLSAMTPMEAAAIYVDTFDLRRGTNLYLTYYRHGDTRERGMALAALVDVYRAAGFKLIDGELPDYLPALLELAATHPSGAAVLREHRPALDALRLALEEADSKYAFAIEAISGSLPAPSRGDREALARYRAQGPPSEQVGLEPFAPPEVMGGQGVRHR